MLFLKSWLEDYIDLSSYSNEQLADLILLKSGEVEDFFEKSDWFNQQVVIGQIQNLRKHPDADKLNVFDVVLGNNQVLQIVSAAPNARNGLVCPVALVGCQLPGMPKIQERKMRGELSQGMCCGKSELLLETGFSSGLWELNQVLEQKGLNLLQVLGKSVCDVLPEYFATEVIFDIKYLADKFSQCSSHLGLAIELAAVLGNLDLLTLKAKKALTPENFIKNSQYLETLNDSEDSNLEVDFQDTTGYSQSFSLFEINLQKPFEMPHLYLKRMFLIDQNIVGSMVDLSNYLLRDVGQPTHFFDLEKVLKLNSDIPKLYWRIEKTNKKIPFKGLGQLKEKVIPEGVEVLYQNNPKNPEPEVLHLPGISGGESTKLETDSQKILVEVANFYPERVAKSSFLLNYRSDGGRFWANRVNPALHFIWMEWLVEFFIQNNIPLTLKKITIKDTALNPSGTNLNTLNLNTKETADLLNQYNQEYAVKVDFYYIQKRLDARDLNYWQNVILEKLNLVGTVDTDILDFYPNIFYSNDNKPEDLLFQVARLSGLDSLKPEYLTAEAKTSLGSEYHTLFKIKELARGLGFQEIITRPFINPKNLLLNHLQKSPFEGLKAISSQREYENYLQDSLLSGLLKTLDENLKKGNKNMAIFETNKIYKLHTASNKVIETIDFDLVQVSPEPYILTTFIVLLSKKLDLHFDLARFDSQLLGKGYVYSSYSENKSTNLIDYDDSISFLNNTGASLLQLSNKIKKEFDLPLNKQIWYLHINFGKGLNFNPYNFYPDQSDFPAISRTYSFFVKPSTKWAEVEEVLTSFELDFDIFIKPLERMNQNPEVDILNFEIDYSSYTRTLNSQEIEVFENNFLTALKTNFKYFEKRGV
jgi:phenylalanyl-tRNA synthetase beta chain